MTAKVHRRTATRVTPLRAGEQYCEYRMYDTEHSCLSVRGWRQSAVNTVVSIRIEASLLRLSKRVNHVQNDDADCSMPVEPEAPPQGQLFG